MNCFTIKKIIITCFLFFSHTIIADGTFIVNGFESALVPKSPFINKSENILNNTNNRFFTIYLPDDYATSNKNYPVVYYLPGLGGTHLSFTEGNKNHFRRSYCSRSNGTDDCCSR